MNIFEYYLSEIHNLVVNHKDDLKLNNLDNIKNINLEVPPQQFNFDLSCNISLVLAKANNLNSKALAAQLKDLFKKTQVFRAPRSSQCPRREGRGLPLPRGARAQALLGGAARAGAAERCHLRSGLPCIRGGCGLDS